MKIKKDFTQIPNKLLKPSKLPTTARYLACVLIRYMMQNELCFPRQMLLAEDLACTDRNIRKLLVKLEKSGYLRIVRTGFNKPNTYILGPELEWIYSSDDTGTVVPAHQGTRFPTNNKNGRIINKNKLIVINKIREDAANRLRMK
jgi:hypothetical protein